MNNMWWDFSVWARVVDRLRGWPTNIHKVIAPAWRIEMMANPNCNSQQVGNTAFSVALTTIYSQFEWNCNIFEANPSLSLGSFCLSVVLLLPICVKLRASGLGKESAGADSSSERAVAGVASCQRCPSRPGATPLSTTGPMTHYSHTVYVVTGQI